MPRFSANLGFLWPDRPLLDKIDAAAGAGFKAIELHWPYDTPAAAVLDRCRQHGLDLLGVNTVRGNVEMGENGLGALAGRQAEFQAAVDQSIRFCREAGGTAIHCMAGRVAPDERAAARKVFVRNLLEAAAKAGQYNLTLLLEPLNPKDAPGYFYSTLGEAAIVLAEVGQPNLKLMFDGYHVAMVGEDVIGALKCHLPAVGHIQIAAVPSRAEPDEGSVDFQAFCTAVDQLGYEGWIGAEYKPRGGTEAGLGWVSALTSPTKLRAR